jgi:hypothetical protein
MLAERAGFELLVPSLLERRIRAVSRLTARQEMIRPGRLHRLGGPARRSVQGGDPSYGRVSAGSLRVGPGSPTVTTSWGRLRRCGGRPIHTPARKSSCKYPIPSDFSACRSSRRKRCWAHRTCRWGAPSRRQIAKSREQVLIAISTKKGESDTMLNRPPGLADDHFGPCI